ncbi:unnamed protein product [Sphagnum balticum]
MAIPFGPEAIELFDGGESLSTLSDREGLDEFLAKGDGIFGIGLESDNIANDYKRLQTLAGKLEKPRKARDAAHDMPLWVGFSIPSLLTPLLKAWVVMNSPAVLEEQAKEQLPMTHPNTCFGLESVHLIGPDPEAAGMQWGRLVEKHIAGLQWNELGKSSGKRLQSGERFFDILTSKPELLQAAQGRQGVFMLTLKVTDLELARLTAQKAGATPIPCTSRDGFIVPASFTGGPALRFVRAYWKRYLPVINSNFPLGRRKDKFRPLGGANTSTLIDGFEDNWKY